MTAGLPPDDRRVNAGELLSDARPQPIPRSRSHQAPSSSVTSQAPVQSAATGVTAHQASSGVVAGANSAVVGATASQPASRLEALAAHLRRHGDDAHHGAGDVGDHAHVFGLKYMPPSTLFPSPLSPMAFDCVRLASTATHVDPSIDRSNPASALGRLGTATTSSTI